MVARTYTRGIFLLGLCLLLAGASAPQTGPRKLAFSQPPGSGPVYVVPIEGPIDNPLAMYVARAVADAEAAGASVVLFHMDTFGGLVDAADQIRKSLLDTQVPTVVFVDKNAASAGALIAYAADRIVMVPGASIGAATVVTGDTGAAAPDKYQSYMRGLMRSTAEANGRDPRIAEAMVDESIDIPGVTEAGKVLTLSSAEAARLGVADAVLSTVDDVLAGLDLQEATIVQHRASWGERALRFFATPVVQSILLLMMLGGLYFELHSPGLGFAGLMALIGAALFFAPHYLLGLVESWEIVLFGIGVILLLIEILILPGFGLAGIAGLLLVVASLFAALVGNVGLRFPPFSELTPAVLTMAATMVLLVVLLFSLGRYLPRSERFNRLVLSPEGVAVPALAHVESMDQLVGRTGLTLTPLRPSGAAEFDGERVDVITLGDFVPSGVAVLVTRVRGSRVEVRKLPVLARDGETSAA